MSEREPAERPEAAPPPWGAACRSVGYVLAAVWIAGTAVFFFIRFSAIFYRANQGAVDRVVERLLH